MRSFSERTLLEEVCLPSKRPESPFVGPQKGLWESGQGAPPAVHPTEALLFSHWPGDWLFSIAANLCFHREHRPPAVYLFITSLLNASTFWAPALQPAES